MKNFMPELTSQPKQRIRVDFGIRDVYNHYKTTTVEQLQKPYETFTTVLRDFNQILVDEILLHSKEIKLSHRLGWLRVKKSKMSFKDKNKLRIDWQATKKAGKKIYHTNDHRSGYKYRFFWKKDRISGDSPYSFIPTRTNKRRLAYILKNDKSIDYFE